MPLSSQMSQRRSGFTLMEIMIVIVIILVLAAAALPALVMLRKRAHKAATLDLMQHINSALSLYLADYPVLGNTPTSSDFYASPWTFFYVGARKPIGRAPYLELTLSHLSKGSGPYQRAVSLQDGQHILDYYPSSSFGNRIEIVSTNGSLTVGAQVRYYAVQVDVISRAGTPAVTSDDIIFRYTKDSGQFEKITN